MVYVWKIKPIKFSPGGKPSGTGRTMTFRDKETFNEWYKSHLAYLAELDEVMNYCKYFVRDKGNAGHYVRDGKSFPVDGSWVGIQDFDNFPPCQPFVKWLEANGWRDNWFSLMERYENAKK